MSFNPFTINLNNYEEAFILYMDNELTAEQRIQVDDFVALHPHLAEELELLQSVKLTPDEMVFIGKADLHSSLMNVNDVEEHLLLYIDNELSAAQKIVIEEKAFANKEVALQLSLLQQTKLDASEQLLYPNKKELYRTDRKVVPFPVWMRIAVAVIILLFSSLFFLLTSNKPQIDTLVKGGQPITKPAKNNEVTPQQQIIPSTPQQETLVTVKAPQVKKSDVQPLQKVAVPDNRHVTPQDATASTDVQPERKRAAIKFETAHLIEPVTTDVAVNKTITFSSVTSADVNRITNRTAQGTPDDSWAFETEKKTSSKGFFRKVSRFVQRNTGIGNVSNDNEEVLVGVMALKLK